MNQDSNPEKFSLDWRIALGFGLSLLWVTGGMLYLSFIVGLDNFIHLPTADIGSFLEGAFAPLAFLWLVIGHFMQQKEISANTKAIGIQERSARRLEMHAQRDSFFKLQLLVEEQLGAIAAFLFMTVAGPDGSGAISAEDFARERAGAADMDSNWFVRKLVALAVENRQDPEAMHNIFFGTELRVKHSENFVRTFRKLLQAAEAVDTDDMVRDALLNGSPSGILYRIILMTEGEELIDTLLGMSNEPGSGRPMRPGSSV
ncbi:hypothetical protein [Haliea sp. E17]|uniref:hypothetical protein n=1 Tax=Haliea sp. E17 TaxID=3401576 RepID=UPI003AB08F1F